MRVAQCLQTLPMIDASFAAGDISYSKARAMAWVATPEPEQDNARKLAYYQDSDGMWVIHARLTPEAGALVVKAINAMASPVQAERQEQLQQDRQDSPKDVSAETSADAMSCAATGIDAGTCVTDWGVRIAITGRRLRRCWCVMIGGVSAEAWLSCPSVFPENSLLAPHIDCVISNKI